MIYVDVVECEVLSDNDVMLLQELETVLVAALEELVAPEEEGHPDCHNRSISDLRRCNTRRDERDSQNIHSWQNDLFRLLLYPETRPSDTVQETRLIIAYVPNTTLVARIVNRATAIIGVGLLIRRTSYSYIVCSS